MTPTTFTYQGQPRPYTVAELRKLPLHEMQRVIEIAELDACAQHCEATVLHSARKHFNFYISNVRAERLLGERVLWQTYSVCSTCDGDGELYSSNGRRATECPECEGSGDEQEHDGGTFTTTLDGEDLQPYPGRH